MATTLNVTSNYAGVLAGEIFVAAFKKADTINKGLITVIPNVIGSGFLPKIAYTGDISAYACGWDPTGTVAYTEKEVIVKKYQIQHELCKDKFYSSFQAATQGLFGANNDIPADFQTAILGAIVDNMAAKVDYQIWNGNGTTDQFNGLLRQFATASSGVVLLTASASLSRANVYAELDRVYASVLPEIEGESDLVWVVSNDVARYASQALSGQGFNTGADKLEPAYAGWPLQSVASLPAKTILVYRVRNIGFLTGLQSDVNEVLLSDDQDRLDGNIRTKVVFTGGVGYTYGPEIVAYLA